MSLVKLPANLIPISRPLRVEPANPDILPFGTPYLLNYKLLQSSQHVEQGSVHTNNHESP